MEVMGYYHANACLTDLELGPVARKIADRIQQRTPHACALLARARARARLRSVPRACCRRATGPRPGSVGSRLVRLARRWTMHGWGALCSRSHRTCCRRVPWQKVNRPTCPEGRCLDSQQRLTASVAGNATHTGQRLPTDDELACSWQHALQRT
jgi:hypothetical protein